jgi:hypothetical protein
MVLVEYHSMNTEKRTIKYRYGRAPTYIMAHNGSNHLRTRSNHNFN